MLHFQLSVMLAAMAVCAVSGCGGAYSGSPRPSATPADAPPPAVDLTKIDRAIGKQPDYKKGPRYGLLVLGLEAKTRIWLVVDGSVLYVDRNGNGDLTEDGERVAAEKPSSDFLELEAGEIVESDGKTRHARLVVYQYFHRERGHVVQGVFVSDVRGTHGQGTHADKGMTFAKKPSDAPIIHVGGPFTLAVDSVVVEGGGVMRFIDYPYELQPGEQVVDIHVRVGTPGLGKGTFAAISSQKKFPEEIHPVVELDLASNADTTARIKAKFTLNKRC